MAAATTAHHWGGAQRALPGFAPITQMAAQRRAHRTRTLSPVSDSSQQQQTHRAVGPGTGRSPLERGFGGERSAPSAVSILSESPRWGGDRERGGGVKDPRFPFSPFCFQKSAASWKPTGPGGLEGTRARAGSGVGGGDRKEGDSRSGDGVCRRRSLATPCPPVRLARALPNHLSPKARELREAVGSGRDSVPSDWKKTFWAAATSKLLWFPNPWIPSPPSPPPKKVFVPPTCQEPAETRVPCSSLPPAPRPG